MESLQNLLSPNSNIKSTVVQAETAIKLMRTNGYNDQADLFENQIRDAIVNKNGKAFSGNVSQLFAFQKKASVPTPSAKESDSNKIAPEDALIQIENALNMGDERGIPLSKQIIKSAALAVGKGDMKGAAKIAGELVTNIEDAIKLQNDEDKEMRVAPDGMQFTVGKKTGTIYTGGLPASRGRQNTESFSSFLGGERKEDIATIPGVGTITQALPEGFTPAPEISQLETIKPQPELYSQQTRPESDTEVPKTTQYIVRARELYKQGNVQGALDILNATNLPSVYGELDEDSLRDILGVQPQQPAPTAAPQAPQPNQTSKGTRFQILPD